MFRPRCFGLKTLILISLTQTLELVLYAFAKSTTALRFCTLLPSFITLLSSSDTAWECFLLSSEFSSQEASPSLLELLSVRYTCPRKSRGSSEAIHHGFPHHCHFDRLIHPHESSSCLIKYFFLNSFHLSCKETFLICNWSNDQVIDYQGRLLKITQWAMTSNFNFGNFQVWHFLQK